MAGNTNIFCIVSDHEIDKAMLLNSDNDSLRENLANVLVSLAGLRPGIFKNCFLSLQKKFFVDSAIFRKTEQVIRLLSANELRQRLQVCVHSYFNYLVYF